MINVTPDHPIAHEAYEQVKNLRCAYVNIIAHTFKKSETEQGFFIAGIYPNLGTGEGGFNRLDWLTEYEQLQEQKMITNREYLEDFKQKLLDSTQAFSSKSLNNVHCKGLFSLVVAGSEHGRLLRVFIAHKKIKPAQIQYHSHRYPIRLTVLKGTVVNHSATWDNGHPDYKPDSVSMDLFCYQSPLNHGQGLTFVGNRRYSLKDSVIPKGCSIQMAVEDIHTVSCSKGSIWIVEEQGFQVEDSFVLGTPFITEGLYTEPKQFQTNDNWQLVISALAEILNCYKVLGEPNGLKTEKS